MEIHQNRENRIIIALSAEELRARRVSFEEMNYGSAKTRRLLNEVLTEAEKTLQLDLSDADKLRMELLPEPNGGCMLLLTLCAGSGAAGESTGLFCTLASADSLFPLAERLADCRSAVSESRLYVKDGTDYIVYLRTARANTRVLRRILSEYGSVSPANSAAVAVLSEHARLLTEDFIASLCV